MKQLNGKRIRIWNSEGGLIMEGLCTGASDSEIRLLGDGEKDERIFQSDKIPSYTIIGGGVTGGYSGLKTYVCKNPAINCAGKCLLSSKQCTIADMDCEVCRMKTSQGVGFKCDFGCVGALEVLPSQVQRVLFDGMIADRQKKVQKNYLDRAKEQIRQQAEEKQKEHGVSFAPTEEDMTGASDLMRGRHKDEGDRP